MRLDTVTAEIRPRSDWEAVDLGLAMVRRDFWRCWLVWWLSVLPLVALGGWWLWESPLLWLLLFWWWKPAGSRMVLFEISRRLFGEQPTLNESLREMPRAWTRRFFHRFGIARFSPWMPVTLAVEDLEQLRGKPYRQRCAQFTRRGEGPIFWLFLITDLAACWFGMAILGLIIMLLPEGQDGGWSMAMETWDSDHPFEIPTLILRSVVACVMLAMSLTDIFVMGAGFGLYINNRTWIEGWDVELAFKRMARRITKAAVLLVAFLVLLAPAVSRAQDAEEIDPAEEIREVKKDPAFKVHTVTEKVPDTKTHSMPWLERFFKWLFVSGKWSGGGLEMLSWIFLISAVGLLLGLIAWLVWANRHVFKLPGGRAEKIASTAAARVVMGMQVSPESLPDNVPDAAWALWKQGRHQEALGLLYRGAISRVIELGRVEIRESDTEGDCLRRVDEAGAAVHPEYFRGITGVWMRLAYAGVFPDEETVGNLCRQWPFIERRKG